MRALRMVWASACVGGLERGLAAWMAVEMLSTWRVTVRKLRGDARGAKQTGGTKNRIGGQLLDLCVSPSESERPVKVCEPTRSKMWGKGRRSPL